MLDLMAALEASLARAGAKQSSSSPRKAAKKSTARSEKPAKRTAAKKASAREDDGEEGACETHPQVGLIRRPATAEANT